MGRVFLCLTSSQIFYIIETLGKSRILDTSNFNIHFFFQMQWIETYLQEVRRSNEILGSVFDLINTSTADLIQLQTHDAPVTSYHLQLRTPTRLQLNWHMIRALKLSYLLQPALKALTMQWPYSG